MTTPANPTPTPRHRHWLYGSNLALLVVIALAVVGFLNYATTFPQVRKLRTDLSSSGINSLSSHTTKLLQDVDAKGDETKQDFELAANFGEGEQGRAVHDLLNEYARRSRHIKLYELADTTADKLEQKIAEKFAAERAPYEAVLQDFDKKGGLADELTAFLRTQGLGFKQIGAVAKDPDVQEVAGSFEVLFSTQGPGTIAQRRKDIQKTMDSTLPDWGAVKTDITSLIEGLKKIIDPLSDPTKLKDQLPKSLIDYLTTVNPAFKDMAAKINAYQARLTALPALKIDEVRSDLRGRYVLVFGPTSVRVISSNDLFKAQPNANNPRETGYTFDGEQAISSALLGMVRPEKPKVVFIGEGRMAPQFTAVRDNLAKNNFEVLEWSPPNPQQMNPEAPPPPAEPPAIGKGVVWVVFPLEAPPQMMGMPPNNGPLVALVKRHLDSGGSALFLAEAANPMMAMMGGPDAGTYPFAELLKPYGIEVKSDYTVVRTVPGRNNQSVAMPEVTFAHFPDHPISKPLEALPTVFFGSRAQYGVMGAPTVVQADAKANPNAQVVVQTDRSPDLFATKSFAPDKQFDATADMSSPVPMGAASSKGDGKDANRVVVLGNRLFAVNEAVEPQAALEQREGAIVQTMVLQFPGNGELFANSVYWLSGYDNMIAVSSKASVAQRIAPISPGALIAIRLGILFGGLPLLALILGGFVYVIRHR